MAKPRNWVQINMHARRSGPMKLSERPAPTADEWGDFEDTEDLYYWDVDTGRWEDPEVRYFDMQEDDAEFLERLLDVTGEESIVAYKDRGWSNRAFNNAALNMVVSKHARHARNADSNTG